MERDTRGGSGTLDPSIVSQPFSHPAPTRSSREDRDPPRTDWIGPRHVTPAGKRGLDTAITMGQTESNVDDEATDREDSTGR